MASPSPAPTPWTLVVPAELDVAALALVAATVAAYVVGVRRLARRGRRWSPARTSAFVAGAAVVVLATQTGIARYDTTLFSIHVVQHVLLAMVAPVFFALGAPVTLPLRAG